jgi:hypothetical protein
MSEIEEYTEELNKLIAEVDRILDAQDASESIIVKHKRKKWKVNGYLAKRIIRMIEEAE